MAFLPLGFTTQTMVTGTSLTPSLEMPGVFLYVYLNVPVMASKFSAASTPIYIMGSADNVNFYRFAEVNTSTVANDFIIASSVSSKMVLIPNFSARYVKVEISGTATNVVSGFTFVCISNQ